MPTAGEGGLAVETPRIEGISICAERRRPQPHLANLRLSKSCMKSWKKVNRMDSRIFRHKKENLNSYKFSSEEMHRKYRFQTS